MNDSPPARAQLHEIESMRRSVAIGGSLTRCDTDRLLSTCAELLAERARIEGILHLGPAWAGARKALNELSKIITPEASVESLSPVESPSTRQPGLSAAGRAAGRRSVIQGAADRG